MKKKPIFAHPVQPTNRPAEAGVALLTVLALLSIFAVVLVGFTYTLRMEEETIRQYSDSITAAEAAEAAVQGVIGQLARDLDPSQPHIVLGRSQPRYISLLDPWAVGYSGYVGSQVKYDARSHQVDTRPERVFPRAGLRILPTPIPLGVDEDPPGDVTGRRSILMETGGDGAPGLKGIDDNLDGVVDNSEPQDDDEDYLLDEDGLDPRRQDADGGRRFFPAGTGYDIDGDRLGIFDENAKININVAGNNYAANGTQVYNLGVGPWELDLPVFLYNRIVPNGQTLRGTFADRDAEQLARAIVNFRYGSVADGGATNRKPGVDGQDDNNNNNPRIVTVQRYSEANKDLSRFTGEPYSVVGNQLDDDDDGLLNEEDERYIGPTTNNSSGTPLSGPLNQDRPEQFRPGDKIDNDGDGYIDELNEGVDDPSEFSIFKPKGDDRPYATVEDLKLVERLRTPKAALQARQQPFLSIFEVLRDSTTIYSQSDEISGPLSSRNSEVAKINPNLSSNWNATDVWSLSSPASNKADFQYGPPVRLEDLLALQVDLDGDWQLEEEPRGANGEHDGIDNDGDGLIDEPSDDWDGNHYPSGDFDGFGEPDVGAQAFQTGPDMDGDGSTRDKNQTGNNIDGMWRILARDENQNDIRPGIAVEGNGTDDDGDGLVDDTGDFNGDQLLSYDPEWHVSEDAWGDLNSDGYPGLGGDPTAKDDTPEGEITRRPRVTDHRLVTSFADDDFDGFADFYDPQVLAAMFAPEWDGVDNDSDGEVDEIGERYIACFDDDEDGRMDEDPPQFQLALNLVDFIDSWMPFTVADDPDVRTVLSKAKDDPVLADPVTIRSLNLYSSRQRAFRMHPRMLAGIDSRSTETQQFIEQMRLMLPNPPETGMEVRFEGVEAIRINEVMAKPMIRLEAEEVLRSIHVNSRDPNGLPQVTPNTQRFSILSGAKDDGLIPGRTALDSNWGPTAIAAGGSAAPARPNFTYLPEGFKDTFNFFLPVVNLDALAPAFIFAVTNVAPPSAQQTDIEVGRETEEVAEWVFQNIPPGLYDPVIYLHPNHKYRPEVIYELNGRRISFRSDYAFGDTVENTGPFQDPLQREIIERDTARLTLFGANVPFRLQYRLTPWPPADSFRQGDTAQRVVVRSDGILRVRIIAGAPVGGPNAFYETSFDRIELINPRVQYVELVNLSTEDLDLSGWQVTTPYGHYILPENTVIGRMKPSFKTDDGKDLTINEGMPGTGVPFEPLLTRDKLLSAGNPLSAQDLDLEDNKLLLAFNKAQLAQFISDNYPGVSRLNERIVEPVLSEREANAIRHSVPTAREPQGRGPRRDSQIGDLYFRVVDVQDDILSYNPRDKYVTLYDPAGNYIDSFRYRTTFNNVIVDLKGVADPPGATQLQRLDLVALPGYRGFEAFERTDPTWFETELVVDSHTGQVNGRRSVPSSIQLDAKQAAVVNLPQVDTLARGAVGGYLSTPGTESDKNNTGLNRFSDSNPFPPYDSHWNGWDFIGDAYAYPSDLSPEIAQNLALMEQTGSIAREAVAPGGEKNVRFYQMLGGFENTLDVDADRRPQDVRYTAFVWRLGIRELIRAGYDPDVDDQLTVRVLGRKLVDVNGHILDYDMPVGEVLVTPTVRVIDPGVEDLKTNPKTDDNPWNIYFRDGERQPVFAKLRHGDTAFTIDLRESFGSLANDLKNNTQAEPIIEIAIILRKSTRDLSYFQRAITPELRPDLDREDWGLNLDAAPWLPNALGDYVTAGGGFAGGLGDDNYFFKGIEIFGRGRKGSDTDADLAKRTLLAGTPGRDNTGYVPAYPRRRLDLKGTQRDSNDVLDNTAYVKNGPLATLGEISRLFTGGRFETINTPLIPQRLEDQTVMTGQILSNPRLAQRAVGNNPQYRIQLAQRERLDQWENQYTQIYNMITTADFLLRTGLININTAPREVLAALPFCPLLRPGELDTLQNRHDFNTLCADFIIEGRQAGGHDMHFGIHDLDDDDFLTRMGNRTRTLADTMPEYKLASVGRLYQSFKNFDLINSQRFNRLALNPKDVLEKPINYTNVFLSTEVSEPDDGPYADIGTLLAQITHLKRRERFSEPLTRAMDRTFDQKPEAPGDLRERLNTELRRNLTPEDMEEMMNRISNLITVRSRTFSVLARSRIYDTEGLMSAQRTLETVYER